MTTETTTNHNAKPAAKAETKAAAVPEPAPAPAPKPAKAPREPLTTSEAVRLMLTTLKRVPAESRARVLEILGAMA